MQIVVQDDGGSAHGGADLSAVQTFRIRVLAVNDEPEFSLLCPEEMLNPRFATLECTPQCQTRVMDPGTCEVVLTVQQSCMDCDERHTFADESCVAPFYLAGWARHMRAQEMPLAYSSLAASALWQQAYSREAQQNLSFSLQQVGGPSSTFLHLPAIHPVGCVQSVNELPHAPSRALGARLADLSRPASSLVTLAGHGRSVFLPRARADGAARVRGIPEG